MNFIPYTSSYYEITPMYERFGNFYTKPGEEMYLYITDNIVPGIEPFRYGISNKMNVVDYVAQEFVRISYKTLYPTVNLRNAAKGGRVVTSLLHRIYMLAFCYIPGCENLEVNHIDGNKLNCTPSNLEWMSHKENLDHAIDYLKVGTVSKLSDDDIIELIEMYNNGVSKADIAKKLNISASYVDDILKGKYSSTRMKLIKQDHPITRDLCCIPPKKLTSEVMNDIIKRYNAGEEFYQLAEAYNIDRSYLTKYMKRYEQANPGSINLRPLKIFSKDIVASICDFFQYNNGMDTKELYDKCLDELGIENNPSNRKALSNIYNRKTHLDVSSKYNFNKSSTTIERVIE